MGNILDITLQNIELIFNVNIKYSNKWGFDYYVMVSIYPVNDQASNIIEVNDEKLLFLLQ